MGLFKSAEERRIERDIKIRQGIRRIEKSIREQGKFQDEFIKNAQHAKKIGDNQQFAFIRNSLKKTAIIWLTVPLALIGVTAGLLLLGQPFGFMSMLGLMSLAGMLIKNAIVLIDQIDTEINSGKPGFDAIVDSGASRLIPVSMAALTTILGMIPLLKDAFFVAMAVTIMFGLGFATILTLVVVPVLYALFFKVPNPGQEA